MTDTAPPIPAILAVAAAAAQRVDESRSVPYHCARCFGTENFYGILRFDGAPVPTCPNHDTALELVPARG
ncbi:MAG: hypothetical protein ABIZ71_01225 [Gemmatimonadales bacterium]